MILGIFVLIFYPSIFEAKASFVIRPRSDLSVEGDFVQAMDTLIGRVEINETFAKIAESKLVRKNAVQKLGISDNDSQYYSTAAFVITGTNLLEIYARGNDPEMVREFADAVGEETVVYIDSLYDVFELEPLDQARQPGSPVNFPSWQIFLASVILGLLISVCLIVFVRFYLHRRKEFPQIVVSDPITGAYNLSFFIMRLREEFLRAGKLNNSFAIALIRFIIHDLSFDKYAFEDWDDDMLTIKERLDQYLNDGDILARYDEYTFSFLLVDLSAEEYRQKVKDLQEEVRSINPEYALEGRPYRAVGSIGFVYYQYNEIVTNAKEIQDFAEYALDKAVKFNSTRTVEVVINPEGEIQENISDL